MRELILVADDDPFNLKLLSELCENAGYAVVAAADGQSVLESVARSRPSLIILDVSIPRMNGFDVCRVIKADPQLHDIPVIVVTDAGDEIGRTRGVEAGADDYVSKPFRLFELQQRIRAALKLHNVQEKLSQAHDRLQELAPSDAPASTGRLHYFRISLEYEFLRAARYGHALCLLAIAVERPGELRQASGDEAGGALMNELRANVRGVLRNTDQLFHQSEGDLLLALLPETPAQGAEAAIARIQRGYRDWAADRTAALAPRLTFGAAVFPRRGINTHEDLLEAVRALLLRAQKKGIPQATSWENT